MISFVTVIAATIVAAQEDVLSPSFIVADDYVSVTSADDELIRSDADDYVSVTSADDELIQSDVDNDADSVYVDGVPTVVAADQFADGEPVDSDEHVFAHLDDEINDASIDDVPSDDVVVDGTPTEDVVHVDGTPTENDILHDTPLDDVVLVDGTSTENVLLVDGTATENIVIDGTSTEASVDDNGLTVPVDFDLTFFDDLLVDGFTTVGVDEGAPAGILVHDGTVTDDYMIDGVPTDYVTSTGIDDGFDKSGDEDDVDGGDGRANEHTDHGALTHVFTGAMCMAAIALF